VLQSISANSDNATLIVWLFSIVSNGTTKCQTFLKKKRNRLSLDSLSCDHNWQFRCIFLERISNLRSACDVPGNISMKYSESLWRWIKLCFWRSVT